MTRRKRLAIVMTHQGTQMNVKQLAEATGLSYYLLSDRYQSGDRDADLIRAVGAPRKRIVVRKAVARKGLGPFHHARKHKVNTDRAQKERDAREREKVGIAAASLPLIAPDLLSSEERKVIREGVIGRQRWWSLGLMTAGR